jgi:hypothetical protein
MPRIITVQVEVRPEDFPALIAHAKQDDGLQALYAYAVAEGVAIQLGVLPLMGCGDPHKVREALASH